MQNFSFYLKSPHGRNRAAAATSSVPPAAQTEPPGAFSGSAVRLKRHYVLLTVRLKQDTTYGRVMGTVRVMPDVRDSPCARRICLQAAVLVHRQFRPRRRQSRRARFEHRRPG